jgi:hypothetical protein
VPGADEGYLILFSYHCRFVQNRPTHLYQAFMSAAPKQTGHTIVPLAYLGPQKASSYLSNGMRARKKTRFDRKIYLTGRY